MINTLALFSPKEKLKLSCYALEEAHLLCPYYALQGFVTVTVSESKFKFKIELSFLTVLNLKGESRRIAHIIRC